MAHAKLPLGSVTRLVGARPRERAPGLRCSPIRPIMSVLSFLPRMHRALAVLRVPPFGSVEI